MSFERQHGDVNVVIVRNRVGGEIRTVILSQPMSASDPDGPQDAIQLTGQQAYAFVDDIAVADPDTWARRDPEQETAELALRRVADYFKQRAEANREAQNRHQTTMPDAADYFGIVADTFDLAMTRVLEEIEALYADGEPRDPQQAVNDNLTRRN